MPVSRTVATCRKCCRHKDMTRNDHDRPTGPARQVPGQGRDPAARRRRTSPFDRVEQPPKKKHPRPAGLRAAGRFKASMDGICIRCYEAFGVPAKVRQFRTRWSGCDVLDASFDVIPTRPAFDLQRVQMKDGLQAALTLRGSQRDSPVQHICAKRGSSELIAPPDLGQCAVPERIRTWSAISPAV